MGNITTRELVIDEILAGYDQVCRFYPHIPPMTMWRCWEYAVYKHYNLTGPVLDLGCGDGQFFRHVWPGVKNVVGVDADASIVDVARRSGIYQDVYLATAHKLPFQDKTFSSTFANCALEHFDNLPKVLSEINRCLKPEGVFLFSVVTDKFSEWSSLPLLLELLGEKERAIQVKDDYESWQNLKNPYSPDMWINSLNQAGIKVIDYWPIVPELTSKLFLLIDQIWHQGYKDGEFGDYLQSSFKSMNNFPGHFKQIIKSIIKLEIDKLDCSGAVFLGIKEGR